MNMEIDEVVLKSAMSQKQPMGEKKIQMIISFVEALELEVGGFSLAVMVILAMAGFFSR